MKTERREETAAMLDALQPLIGEKATVAAATGSPRVSRTPIIPAPASRATPTATPSLPRVILPDDSGVPGSSAEIHPHRRAERTIYGAAALLLLTSVVLLMTSEPRELADGRSTRPTPTTGAQTDAASESARLEIGGRLPANAVITANGRTLTERAISLAPGRYVLTASAPGYATASDTVTIDARRTVVWAPLMVPGRELPAVSEKPR